MIIELFGAPAAGKSWFAQALTAELRTRGHIVELIASWRPAERRGSAAEAASLRVGSAAVLRRLSRPLIEMLASYGTLESCDARMTARLLHLLPPKSMVWSIRLRQYLMRLCWSWRQASRATHVSVFDQAFVQAVCSLALLGRRAEGRLINEAMAAVPKPDLAIRVEAPTAILEQRLRQRERLQGPIERIFELDRQTNLQSIKFIEQLQVLLQQQGQPMLCLNSLDPTSVGRAAAVIEEHVGAKRASSGKVGVP